MILDNMTISENDPDINITVDYVFRRKDMTPWFYKRFANKPLAGYSFSYVLSGKYRAYTDGKSFVVGEGEAMFLKRGHCNTAVYKELPFEYITVSFFVAENECFLDNINNFYKIKNRRKIENLMISISDLWVSGSPGKTLKTKALIYELISCLLLENIEQNEDYNYKKIKNSIKFIEDNFIERYIDVSELAEKSSLSVSQYNRIFKTVFNTTPTKYINMQKIERAKKLLSGTNYQIGEIAEMCGFSNGYYFSKMFKQIVGIPPFKWREENS